MKVLLSFAVSLLLTANCFAASPSFGSFYTNHFTTNGLVIKAKLNPTQFDTNASAITITITNIAGIAGQIWTNSLGVIRVAPEITYDYVAPSNTLLKGWYSTSPQIALLSLGTNVIDTTTQASHLLFSQTNDAAQVTLSLTDGPTTDGPAGAFLEIMSYTNTVWDGRFTLPHGSTVSGGGFVRLNNGQDWIGANGNVLQLKWIAPDWWEIGRWSAGTNSQPGLVVINPTDTYLPYRIDEDEFGDSPLFRTGASSLGLGTNLAAFWTPSVDDIFAGTHDVAAGESNYSYFYLANVDDGTSETNYADLTITLETSGLSPSADINLVAVATNDVSRFNVFLQPDQGVAQIKLINRGGEIFKVTDHGGTYIGAYSETIFGPLSSGEALVTIRDVDEGEADYNGVIVGTKDGDNQGRALLETDGTPSANLHLLSTTLAGVKTLSVENGDTYFSIRAQAVGGEHLFRMEPNDPDGEVPYLFGTADTISSNPIMEIENNTTNILTFGPDDRINFGVGTTNGLFRDLNALWYQNATGSLGVRVDPANYIKFIMFGGTAPHINASSTIYIDNNIVTKVISPDTDDAYDIGQDGNPGAYQDIYLKGIAYLQGANDYAGNLSRLAIEHTGNSGSALYNSTASGTGSIRPHQFQLGGTNAISLNVTNGSGMIAIGPGNTNIIYNDGTDFVFENDNAIGFSIRLRDTSGDAIYSANGLGSPQITSSVAGQPVYLSAGGNSDGLIVASDSLQPGAETMAIGATTSNGAWVNQYFKGTLNQQGANDGSGNVTRLELTHTGNAGNIEYKSAASGTQTFRPHVFMVGTTNVAKFDTTSAAGETRFWLYDEDNGTMERVSVGVADSGGLGYKLLRIPN